MAEKKSRPAAFKAKAAAPGLPLLWSAVTRQRNGIALLLHCD
jgi:hypothetical protein